MDGSWDSPLLEGSGADFDFDVMLPGEQCQRQSLAPAMDRSKFSGSNQNQNFTASPLSGYDSSPSEGAAVSSSGLPLFNIEKDGDPMIEWFMYYDFAVTKDEAYYQLQPGYLPTEKFPSRVKSEKVMM
jgi:hypothetical protein